MQTTPVLFDLVFTTKEAGAALGVTRMTIKRWVDEGHMHPSRKLPGPNGGYLFSAEEVERVRNTPRPRKPRSSDERAAS